jgi:hypothetical protein
VPFPRVTHCIVCEETRAETRGLLAILGFYGIAPAVELIFEDFIRPIRICFLFLCDPAPSAAYRIGLRIVHQSTRHVAFEMADEPMTIDDSLRRNHYSIELHGVRLPERGTYEVMLLADGSLHFQTTFEVRQG